MEPRVDNKRCEGHGKCYLLVPEVFEPGDEYGHARIRATFDSDDDGLKRRIQIAIESCPEYAIAWQVTRRGDPSM